MKKGYTFKRGFTMIELVFVIVILGILASIAIPKLVATKDDAGAVKAAQEMSNAITELVASYTIHGQFQNNDGTSVGAGAVTLSQSAAQRSMSPTLQEVFSRGTKGDNWTTCVDFVVNNTTANILVLNKGAAANYCQAVVNVPAVAQWIASSSAATNPGSTTADLGIKVGGTSIFSPAGSTTANP